VKCLVTGATGFIGRRLCQQLLAQGDEVVALSRSGGVLPDGTPIRAIDLAQQVPAGELLQGVEAVFHLAGIAHQRAPAAAYRDVNERATLELARLASAAGARCFVFLSSVKAMGPASVDVARQEDDCSPPLDAYGLSKWRAETGLRDAFGGGPMAVVIIRPTLVYGAAAKGNLALLARGVRAGLPRPPALGGRSMVSLTDLVELLCIAPADAVPGVQTWIAADQRRYSTRDIYDQLRLAAGLPVGKAWLPVWGWRLGAALLDCFSPEGREPTFQRLFGTELYSNRAVLQATRWQPRDRLKSVAEDMMAAGEAGS